MERAAVTLETERVKWPNPGCLWWWPKSLWCVLGLTWMEDWPSARSVCRQCKQCSTSQGARRHTHAFVFRLVFEPHQNAVLPSILLLRPSQMRIFSYLLIPLNVMVHRHKDCIVRPVAVMSIRTIICLRKNVGWETWLLQRLYEEQRYIWVKTLVY